MKTTPNSSKVKSLFILAFLLLLMSPNAHYALAQSTYSTISNTNEPKIQGQVIDGSGKAMPGSVVLVKGTTTGTAADINGFFALDLRNFVDEKVTLVLSFPNYQSKEVEVDMAKLPIDMGQIAMKKDQ